MFDNRVKAFIKQILKHSGVDKYAYRVEWQIRGMPHIHGVFWLKECEIKEFVDKNSGNLICNQKLIDDIIDKWVSVSLENENPQLNQVVKDVNCHKHTQSCRKYKNQKCRFNFPRFPSDRTRFSNPLPDDLSEDERKEMINEYKAILTKAKEKLENLTEKEELWSIDEFLQSINVEKEKIQVESV